MSFCMQILSTNLKRRFSMLQFYGWPAFSHYSKRVKELLKKKKTPKQKHKIRCKKKRKHNKRHRHELWMGIYNGFPTVSRKQFLRIVREIKKTGLQRSRASVVNIKGNESLCSGDRLKIIANYFFNPIRLGICTAITIIERTKISTAFYVGDEIIVRFIFSSNWHE